MSIRVTFGLMVLNGEPFTRYSLRALYPFAHQIIVVEGACPGAEAIATPQGHSTDGTLEVLRDFQACEDPDGKVTVVTAEDEGYADGFWPGDKDEQCQAFMHRATGNYLWQLGMDEFYKADDMRRVLDMLASNPAISAVTFPSRIFWGGFDYECYGQYLFKGQYSDRVFRWGPGYRHAGHRPPTICDDRGRDLRTLKWVTGEDMARRNIVVYHYSLVFPKQVAEKCSYYQYACWTKRNGFLKWAEENFTHLRDPFRVHNAYHLPSWLQRYRGRHPAQIELMKQDLQRGIPGIETRRTDDIEKLLASPRYRVARAALKLRLRFGGMFRGSTWRVRASHAKRAVLGVDFRCH